MKLSSSLLVILGFIALANCEVYFEEKFLDGEFKIADDYGNLLLGVSRWWLRKIDENVYDTINFLTSTVCTTSSLNFDYVLFIKSFEISQNNWLWNLLIRQTRGRRTGCIQSMKARNSEHLWEQQANSSTMRHKTKVRQSISLMNLRKSRRRWLSNFLYLRVISTHQYMETTRRRKNERFLMQSLSVHCFLQPRTTFAIFTSINCRLDKFFLLIVFKLFINRSSDFPRCSFLRSFQQIRSFLQQRQASCHSILGETRTKHRLRWRLS